MEATYIGILVTIVLALLGGLASLVAALFRRLRNMEKATADLSMVIAGLSVKSEPGWASVLEQAKLLSLHKPEEKFKDRDLLINHRIAGSATPEETEKLVRMLAAVVIDPLSSPIDRIQASGAIIAMKAHDEDTAAKLAMSALPPVPVEPEPPAGKH